MTFLTTRNSREAVRTYMVAARASCSGVAELAWGSGPYVWPAQIPSSPAAAKRPGGTPDC